MSTRRLNDGENDPEMHTNMTVHLCKPAIAKGKPNLTPGGKKKMKTIGRIKKKRKAEISNWLVSIGVISTGRNEKQKHAMEKDQLKHEAQKAGDGMF